MITDNSTVGYEIPKTVAVATPSIHPKRLINYMFSIKLTQVDADRAVDLTLEAPCQGDTDDEAGAELGLPVADTPVMGLEEAGAADDGEEYDMLDDQDEEAEGEDEDLDGVDNDNDEKGGVRYDFFLFNSSTKLHCTGGFC